MSFQSLKTSPKSVLPNLEFLNQLTRSLADGGVVSAAAEAETLFLHFGKMTRADLYADTKKLSSSSVRNIRRCVRQRISGTPLQYLTGIAGFYGHDFYVNPAVLVPRPETEILVGEVLGILCEVAMGGGGGSPLLRGACRQDTRAQKSAEADRTHGSIEILDVGTGSGCIAVSLTIALPDCRMTALDVSAKALLLAKKNARFHAIGDRITFCKSDLFQTVREKKQAFWDLIVSNPPYLSRVDMKRLPKDVRREPRQALLGGKTGLEIILKIIQGAPRYLKSGGTLAMEIGQEQGATLKNFFAKDRRYCNVRLIRDYNGQNRVIVAQTV